MSEPAWEQELSRVLGTVAEGIYRDAMRYRWLKTVSKEQLLLWRGAFGCSDDSIDEAMAAEGAEND